MMTDSQQYRYKKIKVFMFVLVSVFCERVRIKESAGTPDFFCCSNTMKVETSENKPMQNDFQDYLFVFCVIFLIIIAILFAGVVSYLYILFKDYLDSLA